MLVWLKDLQSNWLSWLAVALTMVVSSAACALAVSMLVATSDADDDPTGPLGGTVLGMAVCAVVLITLSQMRLIIEEREPVYRSWRMIGMPGWMINSFIVGQVSAVSAIAALIGTFPARLFVEPMAAAFRSDKIPMPELAITPLVIRIAVDVCVASAVCGALIPLRRVFRPRVEPRPVWVVLRCLVAAGLVGGTVYGCLQIEDPGDSLAASMGLVILVALMTPWLMPALDQWTRLCGIAGANVRVRRRFSVPHIVPWVLLGGLIVAVGSGVMMFKGTESLDTLSSGRVFAAFLGPVVAPSIVGAVLTSLIMRSRIANDVRGLRLAGASPAAWARVQVGEAFCLTVTAAAIVIALSATVVMLLNQLLQADSHSGMGALWEGLAGVWWAPFGLIFGAMFLALCAVKLILAGFLRSTAQIRTN
ncbi:ABC transporter permease [Corynebacterium macginleyi]|uniref:FtsX-like permease family protein n=2 Tax=Corynebacterium macginleyi TaxID=38290 RepID=UPI000EF9BF41|nr:FtsX-like permease family protein [Corynebacterium macginleyi]MBK4142951.1 ABC transporter permease [Corynebacterium macginleyi]MBK4153500.1 ABC transporter permease [Corynebacterium macginleyi]QRP21763.1 FtsX-like permease family protein [Corynebacterium macginleyi]RMB69102.1 FtsX-like permease family protein [Corynebacterium macginleyi]RMB70927.1 FtsX-like permease family protein [Corynebacterium macginleyi]